MLVKVTNLNQSLELINGILKHDIINDLQVVSNSVELFSQREHDSDLLYTIRRRLENSANLIHRMNEFEQLIRKEEDCLEIVNLSEFCETAINNYQDVNIEFTLQGEGSVLADQALFSVIDNLISNAIKHADTQQIDIIISKSESEISLEVIDYGKGLPEEIADRINSHDYKIDRSNISNLGLYIVCKTMKRYKGKFNTLSNSPKGTIMKLVFENPEDQKYH
jgi:signal transduction histidine kinase